MTGRNHKISKFELEIVGESPQIRRAIETAKKIARSSSLTTLIIGESGTGKEIFARMIHDFSDTAEQPFVDINCGAIPETLLESELFGYEKGAFTGANARKQGLFELANGGTIFLDEIGEISTSFQVKMLKAVENKRFRRISGAEEINISTRIIAATNANLEEAVRAGRFREDLYYRLNVAQLHLPPLRDRGDDALLIAEHFIAYFNREYDRGVKGLTASAKELIRTYHWPGNIRQLKNAIERAVLVESHDWIEADHFSIDSARQEREPIVQQETQVITIVNTPLRFEIPPGGISLEEVEESLILSALEQCDGNVSKAAKLLKMNRGKFRYRLDRMNVAHR